MTIAKQRITPVNVSARSGTWLLFDIISVLLCGVYLLIPNERGQGYINFGIPINVPVIVTFGIFIVLYVHSRQKMVFLDRYIVFCILLFLVLLLSTLIRPTLTNTLVQTSLRFLGTYVLTYMSLTYLFKQGYRARFVNWLIFIVIIAAIITLLEGFAGIYLPYYQTSYLADNLQGLMLNGTTAFEGGLRPLGTLGNPLLMSFMLVLSVPFISEIRPFALRLSCLILVSSAIIVTFSRTSIILLIVLGLGALMRSRYRFVYLVILTLAGLCFIVFSGTDVLNKLPGAQYIIRDDTTLTIRQNLVDITITALSNNRSLQSLVFGNGSLSATSIVSDIGYSFTTQTIDNNWFTVLYENGFIGFILLIFIQLSMLFSYKYQIGRNLYWYNILNYIVAGVSFVTLHYSSINLLLVASFATLGLLEQNKIGRPLNNGAPHGIRKAGINSI